MDILKTKKGKLRHKHRVPAFQQIEANDCGPTCIQMVTAYYGMKYPLKTIKRHCDMKRLGKDIQATSSILLDGSDVNTYMLPLPTSEEENRDE